MSGEYPPLTCEDVKRISRIWAFCPPHERHFTRTIVKEETSRLYKVTIDCPKAPFSQTLNKEHGRTSQGEEERFLPDIQATLAANHAVFFVPEF